MMTAPRTGAFLYGLEVLSLRHARQNSVLYSHQCAKSGRFICTIGDRQAFQDRRPVTGGSDRNYGPSRVVNFREGTGGCAQVANPEKCEMMRNGLLGIDRAASAEALKLQLDEFPPHG